MKVMAQCGYCGLKWKEAESLFRYDRNNIRCPHCNDRNIACRPLSDREKKINYYAETKEDLIVEEDQKDLEMYDNYL